MNVSGEGVVVTGAAGGIGKALAARLVREGARVVVNDLAPQATERAAAEIGAHPVPGDVASEAGIASLVDHARGHLGRIDMWFGNAGVARGQGLDASESEWTTSWQVNTMAHVRAARLLVPEWIERGSGRFVVTASAAGLLTALGTAPYSVTKHGAVAFAEWLSATYRHCGIVVQAICPQGVQTDMLAAPGPLRDILVKDGALTPEDVADVTWEALQDGRFLILPQAEAAEYYRVRATSTDRWLGGMNKLQQLIEGAETD
ncbi:SDR family oxidoreductase [Aeromicrobium sp. CTD01-1L150]|uniref:SDR family oxidoreductase n=1 Tax=Aeromicrobium sp. CTD01-1L150 TaxID=3341830 RepID=UPI0035BF19B7